MQGRLIGKRFHAKFFMDSGFAETHACDYLLAAGIAGIKDETPLEAGFVGDAYHGEQLREIPKTLREAIETMRQSEMLRTALGDEVIDHYVRTAGWEQSEHDRAVTDYEVRRGFEQY